MGEKLENETDESVIEGQNNMGGADETGEAESEEIQKAGELNPFEKAAFGWRKRVDKLTYRNKQKDAEIERLKSQLGEYRKREKGTSNALEEIETQGELDDLMYDVRSERRRMLDFLDSDEDEMQLNGKTYSRREVRGYVETLNDMLDVQIPAKKDKLQKKQSRRKKLEENRELAKKTFPELQDEDSAMSHWVAQQMEDENLQENLPMLLGYAFKGLNVTKLREKIAGSKKPAQKKPEANSVAQADVPGKPKEGRMSLDEFVNFMSRK